MYSESIVIVSKIYVEFSKGKHVLSKKSGFKIIPEVFKCMLLLSAVVACVDALFGILYCIALALSEMNLTYIVQKLPGRYLTKPDT